jgi:hypothetical protein
MRPNERRQHPRVDVVVTGVVEQRDGAAEYAVEDLSVGGALLRGGTPFAVGRTICLILRLGEGGPLVIEALVVRQVSEKEFGPALAVAFRNLTADQEDAIQDAMLNALETLNAPSSAVRQRSARDETRQHSPTARRKSSA